MTMELNTLKPAPGSRKARLRVGRGASAGQGKTCGRGVKGQRAPGSVSPVRTTRPSEAAVCRDPRIGVM